MGYVIHIVGASGSGTTTLGRAMRDQWGFAHLDTDDYFWLPTDPPYTTKRDWHERVELIRADLAHNDRSVLTGSLCGWGDELIPAFALVVFVLTDTDTRLTRLRGRELAKFKTRVLPGGDMHANHEDFIAWAATYDTAGTETRSRALHEAWLGALPCPVVRVDGARPVEENLIIARAALDSACDGG